MPCFSLLPSINVGRHHRFTQSLLFSTDLDCGSTASCSADVDSDCLYSNYCSACISALSAIRQAGLAQPGTIACTVGQGPRVTGGRSDVVYQPAKSRPVGFEDARRTRSSMRLCAPFLRGDSHSTNQSPQINLVVNVLQTPQHNKVFLGVATKRLAPLFSIHGANRSIP